MLLFQRLELIIQLIVPWIQDKDLKCESRRSDGEVDQGDSARNPHSGRLATT
jgi:hypothetical protein